MYSYLCSTAIVAAKPVNAGAGAQAESVERREGGQGEHGQDRHAPDTEPDQHVSRT